MLKAKKRTAHSQHLAIMFHFQQPIDDWLAAIKNQNESRPLIWEPP